MEIGHSGAASLRWHCVKGCVKKEERRAEEDGLRLVRLSDPAIFDITAFLNGQ